MSKIVRLTALLCCAQLFCFAQNGQNTQQYNNNNPYESLSKLPPDNDEVQQNYPASGSGPITPP